ncbi:MAG: DUF4046 domain-containing protein [Candidatus Ornithomonoglobus sp.]
MDFNADITTEKDKIIDLYELYLKSEFAELPNSMWLDKYGKIRTKVVLKYFIEEKVKMRTRSEIAHDLSTNHFKQYKLQNMLSLCFNNSIFQAVDFLYPGKFIEEMFKGKRNYWDEEMLAEEIRLIANAQGKEPFSIHRGNVLTAHRYGLIYNIERKYGGVDKFMDKAFPRERWWQTRYPGEYIEWNNEQEYEAVLYVLSELCNVDVTDTEKYYHINTHHFTEAGLKILCKKYDYNIFDLIHTHFPRLKISNIKAVAYRIISPDGVIYETINITQWVKDNRHLFATCASDKAVAIGLRETARKNSRKRFYYGWRAEKHI